VWNDHAASPRAAAAAAARRVRAQQRRERVRLPLVVVVGRDDERVVAVGGRAEQAGLERAERADELGHGAVVDLHDVHVQAPARARERAARRERGRAAAQRAEPRGQRLAQVGRAPHLAVRRPARRHVQHDGVRLRLVEPRAHAPLDVREPVRRRRQADDDGARDGRLREVRGERAPRGRAEREPVVDAHVPRHVGDERGDVRVLERRRRRERERDERGGCAPHVAPLAER
jgi:hypothetical protein